MFFADMQEIKNKNEKRKQNVCPIGNKYLSLQPEYDVRRDSCSISGVKRMLFINIPKFGRRRIYTRQ